MRLILIIVWLCVSWLAFAVFGNLHRKTWVKKSLFEILQLVCVFIQLKQQMPLNLGKLVNLANFLLLTMAYWFNPSFVFRWIFFIFSYVIFVLRLALFLEIAEFSHPTSCASMAEIMSVLFFDVMRYSIKEPRHPAGDRLILSEFIVSSCLKNWSPLTTE